MTRTALYARYSTDRQREASIEDQVRLCRERAEREGWTVTTVYSDHAVSGASLMRPGIQSLMQNALAGKFDLVLTESLDRVSRDQEDIAGVYKRLRFAGVQMVTLSEGAVSELHIGFKGTMGALFLRDLPTRQGAACAAVSRQGDPAAAIPTATMSCGRLRRTSAARVVSMKPKPLQSGVSSGTTPPANRRARLPMR